MSHYTSSANSVPQLGRRAPGFQLPPPHPLLSPPTQWDWKMKMGRENGGWMVARCPVLFLLNLPSAPPPPAASSTSLLSHTPVFPLHTHHSFLISHFCSCIHSTTPSLPAFIFTVTPPLASTSTTPRTLAARKSDQTYSNCFKINSFSVPKRSHLR